jgi:hypothetical protein
MNLTPRMLISVSFPVMMESLEETVNPSWVSEISDENELFSRLLTELPSQYAYVVTLSSYSKHYSRELKRKGSEYKEQYEDMVDKKNALDNLADAIKLQYQGVSRRITVKMDAKEENNMHGYRKEHE